MPFKSKKQEAWAFATKQPFAKDWSSITDQQSLPERIQEKSESRAEAARNSRITNTKKDKKKK